MPARREQVAAAIIAGGRGTRLGSVDKSALTIAGRSILDRQLEALRGRFSRLILVLGGSTPSAIPPELVVVRDRAPSGTGPLAGLDAALSALRSPEEAAVCLAGDLPFLAPPALDLLRDTAPGAQALVPLVRGQPEPLFARYARSCGPAIASALASGRLKTTTFLSSVLVHWLPETQLRAVDQELTSLENINTPEDLARAERLAAARYPH